MLNRLKTFFTYDNPDKPRVWELDLIRGVLMFFVTLCHCTIFIVNCGLFDTGTAFADFLLRVSRGYYKSAFCQATILPGVLVFVFLSGISCRLTTNYKRRLAKMWVFCAVFMGGYYLGGLVLPSLVTGKVLFNIIAVLTVCVTVQTLLDVVRVPKWVCGWLASLLVAVGVVYFYKDQIAHDCTVDSNFWALWVFCPRGRALSPNDFQPLLPHLGIFMWGALLGGYLYPQRKSLCACPTAPRWLRPLLWTGKQSLFVYICAPVVVLGVLKAVDMLVQVCGG